MFKKIHIPSILVVLISCFLLLGQNAVLASSIKDRMNGRIPAINSLKDQGAIGENNKGLLEFRGPKKNAAVVTAENKDRTIVYKAIGKKQGTTAEHVGERRAKMIVNKGKKGHWFQKPDGSWFQK